VPLAPTTITFVGLARACSLVDIMSGGGGGGDDET